MGPGEGLHPLDSSDPIPLQAHTPWMDGASLGRGVLTQTGTKQRQAPPGGRGRQAYHDEGERQPHQEQHGPHERPADHVGSRPGHLIKQLRGQDPGHPGWKGYCQSGLPGLPPPTLPPDKKVGPPQPSSSHRECVWGGED